MEQQQSQWADPSAAPPFLIACTAFALGAANTGLVGPGAGLGMGAWMFAVFVGLIIATIISFARGDLIGGISGVVFGPLIAGWSFMSSSLTMLQPQMMEAAALDIAHLNGWVLLMVFLILLVVTYVMAHVSSIMAFFMVVVDIGILLFAIWFLKGCPAGKLQNIAGWLFFVIGAEFLYTGTATYINGFRGKTVLPMGGPILK